MEREPYKQLRCSECRAIVSPEDLCTDPFLAAVYARVPLRGRFDPPKRECHMRTQVVSTAAPGACGSHMETRSCGPVVEETVGIQEQYVDWLCGTSSD